jgi:hypothetical protein
MEEKNTNEINKKSLTIKERLNEKRKNKQENKTDKTHINSINQIKDSSELKEIISSLNKLEINTSDKPYKRPDIIPLAKYEEKGIISNYSFPNQSEYLMSKYIDFYYYNCETIKDYGWGCAWRTTQTALKTYLNQLTIFLASNEDKLNINGTLLQNLNEFKYSFDKLFFKYGSRKKLDEIYLQKNSLSTIPEYLEKTMYAPFESENGWGEPFISQLIFYDQGINGRLLLINKYPRNAFAPREVFEETILEYNEFVSLLIDHFGNQYAPPIIIDDSIISINILGFSFNGDKFQILIGDPHVPQDKQGEVGIYTVTLTEEGLIDNELTVQNTNHTFSIHFKVKGWMMFIPNIIN